jgi:hypothetical protein
MKSQAFFLVNVRAGSGSHPEEELRQMPGISRVEEVSGVYDFLVEVETAARLTQISDTLMAKPWVKRVHVLRPIRTDNTSPENGHINDVVPERKRETGEHHQMPAQCWVCLAL